MACTQCGATGQLLKQQVRWLPCNSSSALLQGTGASGLSSADSGTERGHYRCNTAVISGVKIAMAGCHGRHCVLCLRLASYNLSIWRYQPVVSRPPMGPLPAALGHAHITVYMFIHFEHVP
jgi:hypothetical protein